MFIKIWIVTEKALMKWDPRAVKEFLSCLFWPGDSHDKYDIFIMEIPKTALLAPLVGTINNTHSLWSSNQVPNICSLDRV